jgi:hypothetical protein
MDISSCACGFCRYEQQLSWFLIHCMIIKFLNLDAILARFVCMEMVIQSTEKIKTKDRQFIDLQSHENNHKESDWCSHLHKFVLVLA